MNEILSLIQDWFLEFVKLFLNIFCKIYGEETYFIFIFILNELNAKKICNVK